MMNRRNFLSCGAVAAGIPLMGAAAAPSIMPGAGGVNDTPAPLSHIGPKPYQTHYISHRGVHLKQRIAGENTIEALQLAKRVGFQCVEFDVRFTRDGRAVVIHDETINRTLRDLDGGRIENPTYVKDLTYEQLRSEYVIHCETPKARSTVPAFEEYIQACSLYKVIPFVEIKESDRPDPVYHSLLDTLERIMGRGNFVITSNNSVNDIYRRLGYHHVPVMGILYQTTFERIQGWGNAIMAISASRFTEREYHEYTQRTRSAGIPTESHADTFARFNQLIKYGTDYISTDLLAPDTAYLGSLIQHFDLDDEPARIGGDGVFKAGVLEVPVDGEVVVELPDHRLYLGGVFLELEFAGQLKGNLCGHPIQAVAEGTTFYRLQVLVHNTPFSFRLEALQVTTINGLRIKTVKY